MNAIRFVTVKSSLYKNTPRMSIIVGVMNCRIPTIDNGITFAPVANNSNGIAVAIPPPINNRLSDVKRDAKLNDDVGKTSK